MAKKKIGKVFVLFLAFTLSFVFFEPLSLLADTSTFDFWIIAGKDNDLCSYWVNIVEHNDEWYISTDSACTMSGFSSWKKTDNGITLTRKSFYKDLDVPFEKPDFSIEVNAPSINYKGKTYYNLNSIMTSLRTKVSYSDKTHLVIFDTCKVFPAEFNLFCGQLIMNSRYYMDDEDTASPLQRIGVNFFGDLFSVARKFSGKDTDETTVFKNIIKTPAYDDPSLKDHFHAEKKQENAFSFINKLCGYYVDVKNADWGKGNTIFSYYGNIENPFKSPDYITRYFTVEDAAKIYQRVYTYASTGPVNGVKKDLKKALTSGDCTYFPINIKDNNTSPYMCLAFWNTYDQWQITRDWETVYANSLEIAFSGDTYPGCPLELKLSANRIIDKFNYESFNDSLVNLDDIEEYSFSAISSLVKEQLKTPWNSFLRIIDAELGLSESISEAHQTYIVNEIQHQCRHKISDLSYSNYSAYGVMGYKYSAILYLRSYIYGCSLWEDGSALSDLITSSDTNPFNGMSDSDKAIAMNYFSKQIDEVAPILTRIIQVRDEDLVGEISNIIGKADKNGFLTFYDDVNEETKTVKIKYYKRDASDYDEAFFNDLEVGSHFYYGNYEQDNNLNNGPEPIEWVVTAKSGTDFNASSFRILDAHLYKDRQWYSSELRRWCNRDFLNTAFADYEVQRLQYMQYVGGIVDEKQSGVLDFSSVDRVLLMSSGASKSTPYAERNGSFSNNYWRSNERYSSSWDENGHYYVKGDGTISWDFFNNVLGDDESLTALKKTYGIRPCIKVSSLSDNDSKKSLYSKVVPGDIVALGLDELDGNTDNGREEIDWIVMGKADNLLFLETYYPINGIEDKTVSDWKTSSLREWLNNDFYNKNLSDQDRSYLIKSTLQSPNGYVTDDYLFPQSGFAKYLESSNYNYVATVSRRCTLDGIKNPVTVCAVMSLDGKSPEKHQVEDMYISGKSNLNNRTLTYKVGDSIYLGNYEQNMIASDDRESIEWIVLNISGNKALVISKYSLDYKAIDYDFYAMSNSYSSKKLKNWLANDFKDNAFSDDEKTFIDGDIFIMNETEINKYLPEDSQFRTALLTHYAYFKGKNATDDINYTELLANKYTPNYYISPVLFFETIGTVKGTYWALNSNERGAVSYNGSFLTDITTGPRYVRPAMWINLPDTVDVSTEQQFVTALSDDTTRSYTVNIVEDFTISGDYSNLKITHGNVNFNGHTITIDSKGDGGFFCFGSDDSVVIHLEGGETGSVIKVDPSYSNFMLREKNSTINNIKIYIGDVEQPANTINVANEQQFLAALTNASDRDYTISILSDFSVVGDCSNLKITHGNVNFNGHTITFASKGDGGCFYFGGSDSVVLHLEGGENGSVINVDPSFSDFILRDTDSTINNIKIYIGDVEQPTSKTLDVSNEQQFIAALTDKTVRKYTVNIVADFTICGDYSNMKITHGDVCFNGHTITINGKGDNAFFYFGSVDSTLIHLEGGDVSGSAIKLDPSYLGFLLRDKESTIKNIKIYVGNTEQITGKINVANERQLIVALTENTTQDYSVNIVADFTISDDYSKLKIAHGNIFFNGHTITINGKGNNGFFYLGSVDSALIHLDGGKNSGASIKLDPSFLGFILRDKESTIQNIKIYVGDTEQASGKINVSNEQQLIVALTDSNTQEYTVSIVSDFTITSDFSNLKITHGNVTFNGRTIKINGNGNGGYFYFGSSDSVPVHLELGIIRLNTSYAGFKLRGKKSTLNNIYIYIGNNEQTDPVSDPLTDYAVFNCYPFEVVYEYMDSFTFSIMNKSNIQIDSWAIKITFDVPITNIQNQDGFSYEITNDGYSVIIRSPKGGMYGTIYPNNRQYVFCQINDNTPKCPTKIEVVETDPVVKTRYKLTVGETQNGSVILTQYQAAPGDMIGIQAIPDTGYELDTIKVEGYKINGTSFSMGNRDTFIEVTFKEKPHYLTKIDGKAATCTEDGYETYYKCTDCGILFSDPDGTKKISEPVVIKAFGHKWDNGTQTLAPTCEKEGTKTFKCTHDGCNETMTEAIPALGHHLVLVKAKDPTKTEAGNIEFYKCDREGCRRFFKDAEGKQEISDPSEIIIPAIGHDLEMVPKNDATCTEAGNIAYYKCKDHDCEKLFRDKFGREEISLKDTVIPATGHHIVEVPKKAPTCTADGYEAHFKCSNCNKLYSDKDGKNEIESPVAIPKLGHDWDDGEVTKEPSCETTGIRTLHCKHDGCKETKEETIPALGHDLDHLEHHNAKSATRDDDGNIEYWVCPRCGKKFSDSECKTELSDTQLIIPAIGAAKLGEEADAGDFRYKVTYPATDGTGTVTLIGMVNSNASVSIPATVEIKETIYNVNRIGPKAFYNNKTIKNLVVGPNVTVIDNYAFYGCTNLVKVSGGPKLKIIGSYAFALCTRLKTFVITSKVLSKIGPYAFKKASSLKTLYIKNTVLLTKSGVKKSLKGSKVKTVKVKKSKVKKYKKYFTKKNCGRKVKVKK